MPLIDANVPANLHFLLVEYLTLIRLDSRLLGDSVESWQKERGLENYRLAAEEDSSYSYLLNTCGYKHSFSRNLIIQIFVAITLLVVIASIFVHRLVKARKSRTEKPRKSFWGAWTINFSLRFTYEIFLEICICVCINLVTFEAQAESSDFLWAIALLLCFGVTSLVAFVVSLFWRGGPYTVPNSYNKSSLVPSFWGKRELCLTNCAKVCQPG